MGINSFSCPSQPYFTPTSLDRPFVETEPFLLMPQNNYQNLTNMPLLGKATWTPEGDHSDGAQGTLGDEVPSRGLQGQR